MNGPAPQMSRRVVVAGGAATLLAACTQETVAVLPAVTIPPVEGLRTSSGWPVPGITPDTFRGGVTVLNVWASWCGYCRGEHQLLKSLAADGRFRLIGLVYKDNPTAARAYLREAGNPYHALGLDPRNMLTKALNQRGVPNTFVIDTSGNVVARVPGALSDESIKRIILSAVVSARSGRSSGPARPA